MSSALLLLTLVSILGPAVLLSAMISYVIPIRAGTVQRVVMESDRWAAPDYDSVLVTTPVADGFVSFIRIPCALIWP